MPRILLFLVTAAVALFVVELASATIDFMLRIKLDVFVGRSVDVTVRGLISLLIWWRLWVAIVRRGRFWSLRWAQVIGTVAVASAILFTAIVIIAQAPPSRDEVEAERLASVALSGSPARNASAPSGPIQATADGHSFWDRYLKVTPTCGSHRTENFRLIWVLTNLGWKEEIACGSRLLFDSGSPDGKPALPDRLSEALRLPD
jgi:hypothetical protein